MCMCMWCVLGMGCVGVCGGHISLIRIFIFIIDCVTVNNNNTVYSYHTEQGIIHFSDKNENVLVLIRKQQWWLNTSTKCVLFVVPYIVIILMWFTLLIYILVLILPISNVNT